MSAADSPTERGFDKMKRVRVIRTIATVATLGFMAAAVVVWPKLTPVRSDVQAAVAAGAPIEKSSMISPLELMLRHGGSLPVEHWREGF